MNAPSSLYQFLSHWRERSNLTQEQVGNLLGVNKSTIGRWEKGERQVDLADLQRLADIYKVDPVALLLSPDNVELARQLTTAKRVLEGAPTRMATTWLDTGTQMRGLPDE